MCTRWSREWAFLTHHFHASDYPTFDYIKPFLPLLGLLFSRLKCSRAFSCSLCGNHSVSLTFPAVFLWTSSSFHYIFFKMWGWKNNQDCIKHSWCKSIMALYGGKCCWVSFWLICINLNGTADRHKESVVGIELPQNSKLLPDIVGSLCPEGTFNMVGRAIAERSWRKERRRAQSWCISFFSEKGKSLPACKIWCQSPHWWLGALCRNQGDRTQNRLFANGQVLEQVWLDKNNRKEKTWETSRGNRVWLLVK